MKFMSGRSFVDTNILVYALAEAEDERHEIAQRLLESLLAEEGASLNVQVLKEFYSVVTGKLKKTLPRHEAVAIIRDLCHAFRVIDDTLPQLERSLELVSTKKISIWDASIIAAAEAGGCDEIYTEDLSPRATIGGVRIVNPFRG